MMEETQVIPDGSTGATTLNANWLLMSPNSSDGLRYLQRFTLALPTGGLAEELVIDESTSLRLKANHTSFNALTGDAPERAQMQNADSTGLRVTLPVPRLISSIRFRNALSPGGKTTQLFRTDGDVISEEAVTSRLNPITAVGPVVAFSLTETKQGNVLTDDTRPREVTLGGNIDTTTGLPPGELGVIDGRIVVRLMDAGFVSLNSDSITEFNLTTGPDNLRVGLRMPALGSETFFLPLIFALNQQVNAGTALSVQLNDLVQRLREKLAAEASASGPPPTLPDPLELELAVESDAPCRFTVSQFAIRYSLARQSFPDGKPKHVLRFSDGQLSQQQVGFEIPSSVTLTQADIRLAGDGSEPMTGESAAASSGQLSSLLATGGDNGLRLDGNHRWSSPIELAEPMLSKGWDLLLTTLTPNTQLHLELVPDNNGTPGGERLAGVQSSLSSPGRRQMLRFELDTPLLLQPGTYWLQVESRGGAAIWYLQSEPGGRTLPWFDDSSEGTAMTDKAGIANWVAADGPAAAPQRFPEITYEARPLPLSRDGNEWVYDMVPALTAATLSGGGLTTMELSVLAIGPRPLTIYAPRIEFEL